MRQLIIKPHAEASILDVARWLSSQYFTDTGLKFVDDLEQALLKHAAISKLTFPLCKNKRLARQGYSCIVFKRKWVVAFKATKRSFVVYEFIWGPKLR